MEHTLIDRSLLTCALLLTIAGCSGGGSGGNASEPVSSAPAEQPSAETPTEARPQGVPPFTDDPSGEGTPPETLIEDDPLQNAQLQTELLAGPDAIYCGHARGSRSLDIALSDCVEGAFFSYQPFYYSYLSAGVDSVPYTGIAFNGNSLFRVHWDWFGASDPGLTYTLRECIQPRLGGESNEGPSGFFRCDELIPAEPLIDMSNTPGSLARFNIKVRALGEDGAPSYIEYLTIFALLDDGGLDYIVTIHCESDDDQCEEMHVPVDIEGRIRVRINRMPISSDPQFALACGWMVGRADSEAVPTREQIWNITYSDFIEVACD